MYAQIGSENKPRLDPELIVFHHFHFLFLMHTQIGSEINQSGSEINLVNPVLKNTIRVDIEIEN